MWVIDALAYIVRGVDERAILAPSLLLILAWAFWLRGPRTVASFRTVSLLGALVCGTLAVTGQLALIAWWRVVFPWHHPHTAYCSTTEWDLVPFLGTGGSLLFSLLGHGPGRALTLLAAILLVVLRASMW